MAARVTGTRTPRVARESLSMQVTNRLRDEILSGRFAPGERLTEARLAAEYGVSRVPVREGLKAMEVEGLVHVTAYTERVVASLTAQDNGDVLAIRLAVEARAVERAAVEASASVKHGLLQLVAEAMQLIADGQTQALDDAMSDKFHRAVIEASGSPLLIAFRNQLKTQVGSRFTPYHDQRMVDSWREHADIVNAIVAGDPERASALMAAHLTVVGEQLFQHIAEPAQ